MREMRSLPASGPVAVGAKEVRQWPPPVSQPTRNVVNARAQPSASCAGGREAAHCFMSAKGPAARLSEAALCWVQLIGAIWLGSLPSRGWMAAVCRRRWQRGGAAGVQYPPLHHACQFKLPTKSQRHVYSAYTCDVAASQVPMKNCSGPSELRALHLKNLDRRIARLIRQLCCVKIAFPSSWRSWTCIRYLCASHF